MCGIVWLVSRCYNLGRGFTVRECCGEGSGCRGARLWNAVWRLCGVRGCSSSLNFTAVRTNLSSDLSLTVVVNAGIPQSVPRHGHWVGCIVVKKTARVIDPSFIMACCFTLKCWLHNTVSLIVCLHLVTCVGFQYITQHHEGRQYGYYVVNCELEFLLYRYSSTAACFRVVGWGTMLQAGRSRVRFPMKSIWFFNWTNSSNRTTDLGSTQPLTEISTKNLHGGQRAAGV
jgi:hypothetical protein